MSLEAKHTELLSIKAKSVDTLFKIYNNNKFNARVYFMNENKDAFYHNRLIIFDEPNGDFSIVFFKRKFGISKTNKMYNRESREFSIIKKGNKFYYKNKLGIKPLIYFNIIQSPNSKLILSAMVDRVPWLRYMTEHEVLRKVSFNTIYSKKLFSLDKALRYEYKVPLPSAKILYGIKSNIVATYLKYYIEYLVNVENLHNTLPTYDYSIFYDTVKMAKILDRKVNCSWSNRRLIEEHDAWSKEITDIVFTEGDRPMNVGEYFIKFAKISEFKLLTTTKEMNIEGRKNNHCVATYVNKVDSGICGIYSIDGYTLELVTRWVNNYSRKELGIAQFKGYKNCEAPIELFDLVNDKVKIFNELVCNQDVKPTETDIMMTIGSELPF